MKSDTPKRESNRWKGRRRVTGRERSRPGSRGAMLIILMIVMLLPVTSHLHAGVEKVEGGIKFTYYDPDAGKANLAGTFNNWNAEVTPMQKDESGYWTIVMKLSAGKHEYKFVVDGAWITDFDNPNTTPDPYGGANSVVEIDNNGEIVVSAAATPTSNTPLSSQVFIGGRYLSRAWVQRDAQDDPRWRMQRPVQNVDFNFRITISDMVHGYTRMRIDTKENFLQPNNIQIFLDEGHIEITPAPFTLTGYYNEEIIASGDPLRLAGDIDLPGTIFDDHVKAGKGTAGAVLTTEQFGIDISGFIANVHDYDIDNDPRLYDNTGSDLAHVRATRKIRNVTPGVNYFFDRSLWWLDFTDFVGTTPVNTGIIPLDEYLNSSGDPSDWFEFEDKMYMAGPDLTLHLYDDRLLPQCEFLWGTVHQGFVTSNRSGINLDNGPIDVVTLDREMRIMHGSVKSSLIETLPVNIEHTRLELDEGSEEESYLEPFFLPDDEANKHIFFGFSWPAPGLTIDYSEATIEWDDEKIGARMWIERTDVDIEFPGDDLPDAWLYAMAVSPGLRWNPHDRFELELEGKYRKLEASGGALAETGITETSFEAIGRGSFRVTKTVSAIFDIRNIHIDVDQIDVSDNYTAPFVGIRYKPTRKVDLVLAYGVDPLVFDVDYAGRHTGRYNFRREYTWSKGVGATAANQYGFIKPRYMMMPLPQDPEAEEALSDARMFVLRVIYNF